MGEFSPFGHGVGLGHIRAFVVKAGGRPRQVDQSQCRGEYQQDPEDRDRGIHAK